ncbi:hemerythrin domain-containing protein [Salinimicrobium xinjiangense]|uniref:hemerythrin domain-containing protein n=1 Tax=Salinimicrobium xinjiangense TaxID=438596 RepID=UPI00041F6D6E|nr:hemerythrin domain-containing protein [Salinimicrobium xinjiangense]
MNKKLSDSGALKILNEEHDHVLQLCSRIRKGLIRNVETARIRRYADWFKENYLEPHFEAEEQLVFPLLGTNVRVKRALANHRRINKLLSCSCATPQKLEEIERNFEALSFDDSEWRDQFWLE